MQGVEPDARGPEIGGEIDDRKQIGKISVTPIAPRTHPVKLHRQRPHAPGRRLVALIGTAGADDQRGLFGPLMGPAPCRHPKAENAVGQVLGQFDRRRYALSFDAALLRDDLPAKRQLLGDRRG